MRYMFARQVLNLLLDLLFVARSRHYRCPMGSVGLRDLV
jgi:hypothetical protein